MASGDYQVVLCPQCGAQHKMLKPKSKLKSYEIYSDGKTISPELNEALEVTFCSKCNTCYWIEDAEVAKIAVADDMPMAKSPSIEQYVAMLNANAITTDEEEILRLELLWAFNDRVRAGNALFEIDGDKVLWENNIDALNNLLDNKEPYSRLLKAEIAREKGDFESAESILSKIKESHLIDIKNQMLAEVRKGNRNIIKFEQ